MHMLALKLILKCIIYFWVQEFVLDFQWTPIIFRFSLFFFCISSFAVLNLRFNTAETQSFMLIMGRCDELFVLLVECKGLEWIHICMPQKMTINIDSTGVSCIRKSKLVCDVYIWPSVCVMLLWHWLCSGRDVALVLVLESLGHLKAFRCLPSAKACSPRYWLSRRLRCLGLVGQTA